MTYHSYPEFDLLQTCYIHNSGYSHLRIEWFSRCPKVRSLQLEWKPPGTTAFSIVPSTVLFFPLNHIFAYPNRIATCRMNKYYTTEPLVDDRLLQTLSNPYLSTSTTSSGNTMTVTFSSSSPLPQGLSLDPREGVISGYPTIEVSDWVIEIMMNVTDRISFQTTVQISVIGCK